MTIIAPADRAADARILCAITFHFDPSRLPFLADVLRNLAEFQTSAVDVVIFTNANDENYQVLERLCAGAFPRQRLSIRRELDLARPLALTWCHKRLITEEFLAPKSKHSHFIYLEADIRLSFANFCYFVGAREALRDLGLIPAFVRIEYSEALNTYTCSDSFWPIYVPVQPSTVVEDLVFVNMPNPYNPLYILDRELALEYVSSSSFDVQESSRVCTWGLAERAAMGLCLERAPTGFYSRYVVPISRNTSTAAPYALVSHLPNNYANNPRSALGKVMLQSLFVGAQEIGQDGRWLGAKAPQSSRPGTRPQSTSNTTCGDQYYLVTHHHTVVYYDGSAKCLRHGPYGTVPFNIVADLDGRSGRLFLRSGTHAATGQPALEDAEQMPLVPANEFPVAIEVEPFHDGTAGLRVQGAYIGADFGGSIARKDWCRQWERFTLVKSELIDGLGLLRGHRWRSHSDGQIVSVKSQPIALTRAHPTSEASALAATMAPSAIEISRDLIFGPARIRLTDANCSIECSGDASGNPTSARVKDITGREFLFSVCDPHVGG